jgi:hypothetical protein
LCWQARGFSIQSDLNLLLGTGRCLHNGIIIPAASCYAGVVQWQDLSFPSSRRGFDSHRPLQTKAAQAARAWAGGFHPFTLQTQHF